MSRSRRRLVITLGLLACLLLAGGVTWLVWLFARTHYPEHM